MRFKDVKVKRRGSWYILSAPEQTDHTLYIAVDSMSRIMAVREFILEVEAIAAGSPTGSRLY